MVETVDGAPLEGPVYVNATVVSCCGSGTTGGHPLVYLRTGEDGSITCPYCSRRFVYREGQE